MMQAATDDPLIGQFAGSYQIASVLGQGGMGKVYRADHPALGRSAAVKVLALSLTSDADLVRRFKVEAQAVARLEHPNIVEVLDFGTLSDGRPFYTMELLRGESLAQFLGRVGRVGVESMIAILDPVLAALEAAHGAGIVHRDLKPENVFLVAREGGYVPKLLDFGVAKLMEPGGLGSGSGVTPHTQTGSLLGTPTYMSPEQASGQTSKIGAPSDLYAVGVMAYELLTGRPPFRAAHLGELIHLHLTATPAPLRELRPDAPADLEALLVMTLAKDPGDRPQTASALRRALRSIAAPQPVTVVEFGTPAPQRGVMVTPPTRVAEGSRSQQQAAVPEPAPAPQQLAGGTTQRDRRVVAPVMAVVAGLCAAAAVAVVLVKQGRQPSATQAASALVVDAGTPPSGPQPTVVGLSPVDAAPPPAPVAAEERTTPDAGPRKKAATPAPAAPKTPTPDPTRPSMGPIPDGEAGERYMDLIKEGKEALFNGDYDLAYKKIVAAVELSPDNQEALYLAVHASCMRGEAGDAKKYYARMSDERLKVAIDDMCTRFRGIYLTPKSENSPADRTRKAQDLYGKGVDVLLKDPAAALGIAEEMMKLQPSFEAGWLLAAMASCRLGKVDDVKRYLKRVGPNYYDLVSMHCEFAKVPFPDPRPTAPDAGP